mmetsp:Transcript_22848/g.34083  ORF Transcript_22848/g.34083 Transcript_22848/m.34083 type:complete len:573 (+) Transcript_22848:136-1854(+)|eukprot:CAMPEP_0167752598 /NCGR_PEP_ID=MMETSP0110_2-20121227/7230_1 /TAXON_ID=629695 /ORGANISM="Gymnochlora sp., Strain CCMP2014" /LENGTH=572 /DNA_ID=CAMNT_0007638237 /DNA_START=53 /DNA_END=1771 /DNA_ORIENTATION=+
MGNQQLGKKSSKRVPEELEAALLKDLQRRAAASVSDTQNEVIVTDLLRRFWSAVHPPEMKFIRKGKEWQSMGFQGEDPITDFRAGGLLALENIVFFTEKYTDIAKSMIKRREMKMSEDGTFMQNYPWSAAGVNVTHTVLSLFGLSSQSKLLASEAVSAKQKRFWELVLYFNEVYCVTFSLLDDKYTEMNATYLSFNKVLEATREDLNGLLKHVWVQDIFKKEHQPLTLFLQERRRTSSPRLSSKQNPFGSRSATPEVSEDENKPGPNGRPSAKMSENLMKMHMSIIKGRHMLKLPLNFKDLFGEYEILQPKRMPSSIPSSSSTENPSAQVKRMNPPATPELRSRAPTNDKKLDAFVSKTSSKSQAAAKLPCRIARALYDFEAQADGDLTLAEGDTVTITESDASGWWKGQSKNGEGRFPSNYIEEYKSAMFVALTSYDATTETEMSLKEGEIIILTEVDPSGWWKGKKQGSLEIGWFPAAYVESQENMAAEMKEETTTESRKNEAKFEEKQSEEADDIMPLSITDSVPPLPPVGLSETSIKPMSPNTNLVRTSPIARHGRAETLAEFAFDGE